MHWLSCRAGRAPKTRVRQAGASRQPNRLRYPALRSRPQNAGYQQGRRCTVWRLLSVQRFRTDKHSLVRVGTALAKIDRQGRMCTRWMRHRHTCWVGTDHTVCQSLPKMSLSCRHRTKCWHHCHDRTSRPGMPGMWGTESSPHCRCSNHTQTPRAFARMHRSKTKSAASRQRMLCSHT